MIYGYARVSTDRQADMGESLAVQERQIEGYAMMRGLAIGGVFVERGVSGSVPFGERPEGGRLLRTIEYADAIVSPKLDRMFRSADDALRILSELKKRRVGLHLLDLGGDVTNGISKLVFTILSAVAEQERDRTRERVREVKADQRRRGRYLGGDTPFGWRLTDDGGLEPDPVAAGAMARMRRWRGEGRSLRAISEGLRDAYDIRLSHEGVRRALAEEA